MSDTYEKLVRARGVNIALQHLVKAHRDALLALIAQPFSPKCIAQAKAVCSTQIDTSLAEEHVAEFMEFWRQVNGEDECPDFSNAGENHGGRPAEYWKPPEGEA